MRLFLCLVVVLWAGIAQAVTIPVVFDESDASGTSDLSYCTIYRRWGAGSNWYPVKDIPASTPDGGATVATTMDIHLIQSPVPRRLYVSVSCTNLANNESAKLAAGEGNPVEFD